MTARSSCRGHATYWDADAECWRYTDNDEPLPGWGGEIRACAKPMTSYPESVSDGLSLPCGVCDKHPVLIDYTVTDEVWGMVPGELCLGVICLDCLVSRLGPEIVLPGLLRIQVATPNITVDLRPVDTYYRTERVNGELAHG